MLVSSLQVRVPSWTDRVLFKIEDTQKINATLHSYQSMDDILSSDHKPVKAHLCLKLNKLSSPMHQQEHRFLSRWIVKSILLIFCLFHPFWMLEGTRFCIVLMVILTWNFKYSTSQFWNEWFEFYHVINVWKNSSNYYHFSIFLNYC